jgi:hypothetical protein
MHGTFFYIGLGVGLAAACGLRPFVPVLLAGALARNRDLGIGFGPHHFHFLQSTWWLLAAAVALVAAYAAQLLLGLAPTLDATAETSAARSRPDPLAASITGLAYGTGALLFAGTLDAHGDLWWPGLLGGLLVVWVAQRASAPVIARARVRLPDRGSREALTLYLDTAALVAAALAALLHPLGYLLIATLGWFSWRGRGRGDEKYAGLRILSR